MARRLAVATRALGARYSRCCRRLFPGAEHVTDKRPDNFLYIGLIKTLFPDARIIHTTRNPLDNCLSIFFLHLDHSMGYALDLMDTGHYYAQYRRLMSHWKSLYGADILDFDYDAFVREPRPAVAAIARVLRARVGRGLHVVSARAQRGQDRKRVAGARAAVSAVVRPLAQLRGADRTPARATCANASDVDINRSRASST